MKKNSLYAFLLLLLSALAALFGTGLGYKNTFTAASAWELFENIQPRDGWIQTGSKMHFPLLATRGNRLEAMFNPWRAGNEAAVLLIHLCGKESQSITVENRNAQKIFLTGNCEPRTLEFEVKNPFVEPGGERLLGVQFEEGRITSALGIPLYRFEILFFLTLAFFLFALYVLNREASGKQLLLAALVPASGFLLLIAAGTDIEKVLWLEILAFLFLHSFFRSGRVLEAESSLAGEASKLWLPAIVLLAVFLRFSHLDFGLPAFYHPDEIPKLNALQAMESRGDLNPRYFYHPSGLLYSAYFLSKFFGLLSLDYNASSLIVLGGRTASALAGTLSVLLVFLIGKQLFSRTVGLWAAALLAVFPLHVTVSRYMKEDALLTCAMLLVFSCSVLAAKKESIQWLLLSALCVGVATSLKYTGALSVILLLLPLALLAPKFLISKKTFFFLVLGALLSLIAFFAITPYALLDYPTFLKDLGYEARHVSTGHSEVISPWSEFWLYHFRRSLTFGVGAPLAFLCICSLGFLLKLRKKELLLLALLAFALYLVAEASPSKPAPQAERYIVPVLPFMTLFVAGTLSYLRRPAAACLLLSLAFLWPLVSSFRLLADIEPDTRQRMGEWIEKNIEPGRTIVLDWKPYNPELDTEQYKIEFFPVAMVATRLDAESLESMGADYLLLSSLWYDRYFSQPNADLVTKRKFERLFSEEKLVHRVEPGFRTYGFHNPELRFYALRK